MDRRVKEINRKHVRRKRLHKIATAMAALAAFCTTYALILPAITMSRQLVCGFTEYSHTQECYVQEQTLICQQEAGTGHSHGEDCYTQQTIWICGIEETDGHSHSESCQEIQTVSICGLEEGEAHTHTEACCTYEQLLICGIEEAQPHTHSDECAGTEQVLLCESPEVEAHEHSESCYALQDVLVCTTQEHTHSEFCYDVGPADANADVETQEDWERSLSGATGSGDRSADVAAVAMSQLGYRESIRNYVVVNEWTLNGYTRYGAWYGDPYGDWDAMFASFVLHYAGVDELGRADDPAQWAGQIAQELPQRYRAAGEYDPGKGDLLFFDRDKDGGIDGVGILAAATEDTWQVVQGDADDAVAQVSYAIGDSRIAAYGLIAEAPAETAEETEPTTVVTEYTITYMANNGTEETAQQQACDMVTLYWEGFSAPEGMVFSGWNTAPDGSGTGYADGESLELTEDLTVYAQWEAEEEEVTHSSSPIRASARAAGTIGLAKQIEWTGANSDDYSYRLHLTMDGSTLKSGTVITEEHPTRNIGILIDVTETMTARGASFTGMDARDVKFDVVRKLLQEADGFLSSVLDGKTHVSIIVVGGQHGTATYDQLSNVIASGTSINNFNNINNSLHNAQTLSYVTGLMAAEKYERETLHAQFDSLVYIVGNAPKGYLDYETGKTNNEMNSSLIPQANYDDYEKFMGNHPNLTMHMLGIAPVEGGNTIAKAMGDYSANRGTGGGYYEADSVSSLKTQLQTIANQIVVPGDKTTNITISDALSSNVALADNVNLTATLSLLDSSGSATSTTDVSGEVSISDGVLTFTHAAEIEGPFKIEIAFNIKTADGVYRTYTDTGDANTDWGTNTTSSGQKGFYSNGEATASYTLNDTSGSQTFPKPVVQAPEKATIQLTKEWPNAADEDKQPVTVELHRGTANGDLVGTVELNADNGWTASCDVKILTAEGTGNQIYIVEQAVEGFAATYSVDNVSVAANETYSVTVTNTKLVVEKTASLTVKKLWQSVSGSQEAVIHVCTYDGVNTYADIEGSPFKVTGGQEESKTFTITWTGEDAPVICVYEEHSDAFYPVLTGDGAQKNIPLGGYQVSAMQLTPEESNEYLVTLTNLSSVQMPETGGPGTQVYVFGGLVLIFGAMLLMQIHKRKIERRA